MERKAEESKQTRAPVKCLSSLTELRTNEGLSTLAAAAGKGGGRCLSQVRPGIRTAAPPSSMHRILRGNVTTLMAALSLQAVFTNTGCAMVAPGACKGLISN